MSLRNRIAALAALVAIIIVGWWAMRPAAPASETAATEQPGDAAKPLTAAQLERMGVKTAVVRAHSVVES